MQFLPLSSIPYGNAVPPADAYVPIAPATEDEVNLSASLNEWILPGSSDAKIDWASFKLTSVEHPQQRTMYVYFLALFLVFKLSS
jgi:hypothetical protein